MNTYDNQVNLIFLYKGYVRACKHAYVLRLIFVDNLKVRKETSMKGEILSKT